LRCHIERTGRCLRRDRRSKLQISKIRHIITIVAACADANELDLRHDEAVATGMLAHATLQVGQTVEVLNTLVWLLIAHAGIPAVEALDESNDPAARRAG
jgi:hypothetical protein